MPTPIKMYENKVIIPALIDIDEIYKVINIETIQAITTGDIVWA
jgi:hypothetical protein